MKKIILLFFCMVTLFLQAQDPLLQASIRLIPEKISLDQTVDIQLNLKYPEGYHTDISTLQEHLMRNSSFDFFPFSFISEPKITKTSSHGTIQETILFTLQPEIPGTHKLSFLNIPLYKDTTPEKPVENLISGIFQVSVSMPSSSLNEIHFVPPLPLSGKLPINLSGSNKRATETLFFSAASLKKTEGELQARKFPWEKIGAAILCVLAGLIAWVMTRDKQITPITARKKIKESEKAFVSLKRAHLLEKGELSSFMEQLSDVLKKYLEEQSGLQAEVLTTDELVPHVASQKIQQFFLKSDLVKFAGYRPTLEECQQAEALVNTCLKHS